MSDIATPAIKADTVEALVIQARELLRYEDGREQSFTTRAATAAAFCGLIVSVSGAVAASVLTPNLGIPWKWAVTGVLALVFLLLLVDLLLIVFGVLMPRENAGFAMSEIAKYPTWEFISQERVHMQGRILHGLVEMIAVDRHRNARKAVHLRTAYRILGMVAVALATLGLILGLHAVRVI